MNEIKLRVIVDGKIIGHEVFEDGQWYHWKVFNNGMTMGEVLPGVFSEFGEREQYTGLRDKNGDTRELYDGDVMECEFRDGEILQKAIEFSCGCWVLKYKNTEWSLWESIEYHKAKLIGNTHDNPELLQGGE